MSLFSDQEVLPEIPVFAMGFFARGNYSMVCKDWEFQCPWFIYCPVFSLKEAPALC